MPRLSLTDRAVTTAKPGDLFDMVTPGLNLRVTPAGVRTWYLVYSAPVGKRARVKLGRYPQVSLAEARALAVGIRKEVHEGRDPRAGTTTGGAMTVADLIEHYIAKHVRTLRTSKEVERRLRKNVVPVIGATPLASLHRRDIIRVLDPVLERGAPLESLKVFKDCRALLRWAVERGELDASPMDRMKPPAEEKSRERVLTDDELQVVWHSTALAREDHRTILRLCLLTAQRLGEVTGMVCDEVDLKSSTWTIPAKRSKNGHKHAVPLSAAALALVRDAVTAAGGDRLFVGAGDSSSIGKCVSRARFGIAHWTVHDLRRTAVTQMAELGVSPIVLAHVINHRSVTKAGVTLSVYSRYDYAREKREALELWANRLEAIVGGGAIPLVVGENSSSPLRC